MTAFPIRLKCGLHVGTGFLVSDNATTWLVTCVHLVTGSTKTPPSAAIFKDACIEVLGTSVVIPLLASDSQRFSCVINELDGFLIDAMAVRLLAGEAQALSAFGSYPLSSLVTPSVGDRVVATGFAGLHLAPVPALAPASVLEAEVTQVEGVSIALSKPGAAGMSGGPSTTDKGLVGVFHGDLGSPDDKYSGLIISLPVIASHIFK